GDLKVPLLELTHDLVDDLGRFATDIDYDRALVWRGLLQCRELAVEQGDGHEVLVPRGHAPANQIARSFEVDEHHVAAIADGDVPVGSLQRRAGEHATFTPRAPAVDLLGDLAQPGHPVRIRQRSPAAPLLHIR